MATTRRLSALERDTTTIPQLTLIASGVFGGRRNKSFHIPQADHWRWIPAHCLRRSVVLDNWRERDVPNWRSVLGHWRWWSVRYRWLWCDAAVVYSTTNAGVCVAGASTTGVGAVCFACASEMYSSSSLTRLVAQDARASKAMGIETSNRFCERE